MAEDTPPSTALVFRFASSIPDITLSIPNPQTTSIAHLVVLLREVLPSDSTALRIRLIHGGRILSPRNAITTALRLPAPPPPTNKGKAPAQDATTYIHASLSEPALSPDELVLEREDAERIDSFLLSNLRPQPSPPKDVPVPRTQPQGFDRLLSAGLSTEEIGQLRSQFRDMQAYTHTPDTMPSSSELGLLEEAWLNADANSTGLLANGLTMAGSEDTEVNDLLWGHIIGFFWPLGALFWGLREEGVWSAQRQLAVMLGVFVNLGFGVLLFLSTF